MTPSSDPVERLPPEIVDEILGFIWGAPLSCEDLPESLNTIGPLAAVSRKWKPFIERITFRELVLTPRRVLEALEAKYYASEGLLNTRAVLLELPHAFCVDEDTDMLDRQVVESLFSKSIHQIFEFLKHLLHLERPHVQLTTESDEFCDKFCRAFDLEFLELDANWENFPELPMILSFNCVDFNAAYLSPQTHSRLASKMTRLDEVWWLMQDRINRYRSVQVKDLSNFGRSLDLSPKSLTRFRLSIFSPKCNHSYHAREPMHTGLPDDIFSQGVRRLIQRDGIIEVSLEASVDSNMFCSMYGSQEDLIRCPTLEKLLINFHDALSRRNLTAREKKLISPISIYPRDTEGPDISNSSERNRRGTRRAGRRKRRQKSHQKTMDRFHLAAARSVSHMPKIAYFSCRFPGRALGGFSFSKQSDDRCKGLMVYGDPDKFKLSQEALDAWKATAESHGIALSPRIMDNREALKRGRLI